MPRAVTPYFGGSLANPLRQATGKSDAKDDRPTDNISFAATNLVKPGIQSRKPQTEAQTNMNVFPPTPPPENDRPGAMSRGASVRNGGPKPQLAKLNMDRVRPNGGFEKTSASPQDLRRRPSKASTSQMPMPMQRSFSQRAPPPPRSVEEDEYQDDLYDMYQSNGGSSRGSRSQGSRRMPRYIEEEDEDGSEFDDGSFDEAEFEMVGNRRANSVLSRTASRRPDIRKVRIKVHSTDDVRYVMVGMAVEFPDLVDRIRDKFGLRRRLKLKVREDEVPNGDMITMGDQDDLDMVLMSVKSNARRQRQDIGRMEVSSTDTLRQLLRKQRTNLITGLGARGLDR